MKRTFTAALPWPTASEREPFGEPWAGRRPGRTAPGPARPRHRPAAGSAAGSASTASACRASASDRRASTSRPVLAVAEDLAMRLGVGGQHDAAGGHRLQQRARDRDRAGPGRRAGRWRPGPRRRRRASTRPRNQSRSGSTGGCLLQQVRRVIPVVERDVQPAPDDRVAHDDAEHIGASPQQGVGQPARNRSKPAEAVERPGDEADDARRLRDRPARRSTAGRSRPRAGRDRVEPAGVDAVVQDQESSRYSAGKSSRCQWVGVQRQGGLLQVEQVDRGHRPPPVEVGRRRSRARPRRPGRAGGRDSNNRGS